MVSEFRMHRLSTNDGDDVLNFYSTLLFALTWLRGATESRSAEQPEDSAADDTSNLFESASPGFSSMDVDDPFPAPATICNMPPAVSNMHVGDTTNSSPAPRSARRKAKRMANSFSNTAGHDFRCPFCPRMFHRSGLFDHL